MEEILQEPLADPGNIAYLGDYRQLFVPYVRLRDPDRSLYVLRTDRLLNPDEPAGLRRMAHDYRARWFFIEPKSRDAQSLPGEVLQEAAEKPFELISRREFTNGSRPVELLIYRYSGSWADATADIPINLAGPK